KGRAVQAVARVSFTEVKHHDHLDISVPDNYRGRLYVVRHTSFLLIHPGRMLGLHPCSAQVLPCRVRISGTPWTRSLQRPCQEQLLPALCRSLCCPSECYFFRLHNFLSAPQ